MTDASALKHTPLHEAHIAAGAKMVDFGGWHMPLQYKGILAEHKAVREAVGIFDVSHMGEIDFTGARALDAIQRLVTNDASKLEDGQAMYTAVCYPDGGIVDDCIVYRRGPDNFRIVVNASNIEKDFAHFKEHAGELCSIVNHSEQTALLAVQGPEAVALVASLAGEHLRDVPPFSFAAGEIDGIKVYAARTGYTGEDGFELFIDVNHGPGPARAVWDAFVARGAEPIGLGARDTLRLEAKLCLYGNDIDASTTPLEARLGWTVKLRKAKRGAPFVGCEALKKQKKAGLSRALVGFKIVGKGFARPGALIVGEDGQEVGKVTSGGPAPHVGGGVGIGYVPIALTAPGTELTIQQRRKQLTAEVVKGPFYRRPDKGAAS